MWIDHFVAASGDINALALHWKNSAGFRCRCWSNWAKDMRLELATVSSFLLGYVSKWCALRSNHCVFFRYLLKIKYFRKMSMAKSLGINSCTLRLKWAHVSLLFWRAPFLARLRTERYLKWNAEVWWCYSKFFWVAICLALFRTIPRFLPLPLSL